MSYDEATAARLRKYLADTGGAGEVRMMGALCFMVDGHMCCGVTESAVMVRVGREAYRDALEQPHVRPMEMSGRTPRGFVLVDPDGVATDGDLARWIERAREFVRTLPPKAVKG